MSARKAAATDEWAAMAVDDRGEKEQEMARDAAELYEESEGEDEEEEERLPLPPPPPVRGRKRKRSDYDEREALAQAHERMVKARVDNALYRRQLINRIKNWRNALPDYADPIIGDKNLEKMRIPELESLFVEIKTTVGSKTSSAISGQMSAGVVAMTQEALTEFTPLKVDGPRVKLVDIMKTKEAQDLTKELALTFAEEIYTNPLYRAGAFLVNAVTQVHHINTMDAPQVAHNQQPTDRPAGPTPSGDGKRDTNGFEMPQGK